MKKHLDVISSACTTLSTGSSFGLNPCAKAAIICVMALQTAFVQAADFANATVVGGVVTGSTVGTVTNVNQTSQRGAVDWTQLSTAANETLQFNLPNASAMIFNRITGSSPSSFQGAINSSGQVFIQNPNGILFGAGSQVNVGGLVASTLSMTPGDFMNGNFVFTKDANSTGTIHNLGNLTAAQGGFIALLSPSVTNEGIVSANLGKALLAAGNKVTLGLNNGSLLGYSIDQGAVNALIDNKQLVQANGGEVIMSAKALDSLTSSSVNNTGEPCPTRYEPERCPYFQAGMSLRR